MSARQKVLFLTGASGFLGSAVEDLALREGWAVRVLARSAAATQIRSQVFEGSLQNDAVLRHACEDVDAVIHMAGLAHVFGKAANQPAKFRVVNEHGTANVARAAVRAGVPRLILASSVSVYGAYADGNPCDETVPCAPVTPYAQSKYAAEQRAAELVEGSTTALTTLRFATIYGEGDRGNVSKLVSALRRGRFFWAGDGTNRKSLIYRADAAEACLAALGQLPAGRSTFNVSAPAVTMQQIVSAICDGLYRPAPHLRVPDWMLTGSASLLRGLGDPGHFGRRLDKFLHDDVYPGDAFEKMFGFRPKVSLAEGMRRQAAAASEKTT